MAVNTLFLTIGESGWAAILLIGEQKSIKIADSVLWFFTVIL